MSDVAEEPDRDEASGRFLPGNKRGGRPKGARDRHSRNFLTAFADDFEHNGVEVIRRVREEQPAQYLKIAADLLPKESTLDVDVSVFHDVRGVVEAYRMASELLGTDPRRGLRRLKEIQNNENDDVFPR
ncbi:hypothetical protein [Bradyrhizobium sp. AUGA SZCCT0042]|uniref:hypothetical protein n=1 Tax=Bradyrhizobium sp. AUGA SZCCT0042 TaxID=2807651 RepID=UPI001BAA1579|nr:hypothetical protein [Bradyrhizobium sp. AUGA SZCCT0042]MBR1301244.1 hypothetical protein [Bradyrhizobium sp. AUGA SZCCT0042]